MAFSDDDDDDDDDDDEDDGRKFTGLDKNRTKLTEDSDATASEESDEEEEARPQRRNDEDEVSEAADDDDDEDEVESAAPGSVQELQQSGLAADHDLESFLQDDGISLDPNAVIEIPKTAFDIPFIVEYAPKNQKETGEIPGFFCKHCDFRSKSHNATKVKAHLACIPNQNVKVCMKEKQPANYAEMYQRQWEEYLKWRLDRSASKEQAHEEAKNRRNQSVEEMVAQGSTRNAKKAKQHRQSTGQISMKSPPASTGTLVLGQTFLPGTKENNVKMDHQIAAFCHRGGRSFNIVEDPDFLEILKLAKGISHDYKPPNRKLIAGDLLDMEYKLQYKRNMELLQSEADVYGLALYADGATIAKTPFINILGSGVKKTNACLEIHDCTGQMEEGGKKDSKYIYDLMMKHILNVDPKKTIVDMVIFDGASNMQKAGKMIEHACPKITCVHGGEHLVSLFFSDVAKTSIGKMLIKLCRKFYKWFGGRHHSCYALFQQASSDHNGRAIGLIRPADTRMGGYWIAWTRIYRLKDVFASVFANKKFKELKKDQRPPLEIVQLFKSDDFWTNIYAFLRAMHGPLRILRYCDMKTPIMDKLYYLGSQATTDLIRHRKTFNDWEELATEKNSFISLINAVLNVDDDATTTEERLLELENFGSGFRHAGIEELDPDDDLNFSFNNDSKFWGQIILSWRARFKQMTNPYVYAGWTLSPHSIIQNHVKENLNGGIKEIISSLVLKLLVAPDDDAQRYDQSCGSVLNQYWSEWDEFNTRTGKFAATKHFWKSGDIDTNKTWQWHKNNSFYETQFFGKFACRVTSKIAGIGNAERCWGDVKTLKDGKRSHLSSGATSKQATIYGSACAERAEREMLRKRHDQEFTMWDDIDMDALGLQRFGKTSENVRPSVQPKKFKCYMEDWEASAIKDKDPLASVKLVGKYGGIFYLEGNVRYRIHLIKMNFIKDKENKKKCWHVLGCTDSYDPDVNDEETFDNMEINNDLHGLIYTYYHEANDKTVEMVVAPGTVDEMGKWIWKHDEVPTGKKKASATHQKEKASATRAGASSSRAVESTSRAPSSSRAAASSTASARTTGSSPGKRGNLSSSSKPSAKKSRR
jgi:Protein of unknown function (DUF 659)